MINFFFFLCDASQCSSLARVAADVKTRQFLLIAFPFLIMFLVDLVIMWSIVYLNGYLGFIYDSIVVEDVYP